VGLEVNPGLPRSGGAAIQSRLGLAASGVWPRNGSRLFWIVGNGPYPHCHSGRPADLGVAHAEGLRKGTVGGILASPACQSNDLGPLMLIERDWALAFATDWIEAWNAADLERILEHYADCFEMSSPLIRERMGVQSGHLAGKDAIRSYWVIGLSARPPLRFELIDVFSGMDVVAILYRNVTRDRLVIERLRFDENRRVIEAEALHCVSR
jgi:SnoaL-like domain